MIPYSLHNKEYFWNYDEKHDENLSFEHLKPIPFPPWSVTTTPPPPLTQEK